ncbi:hypothetical protein MJT46_016941, partial [Ovis ammon polii x Ovis aries]
KVTVLEDPDQNIHLKNLSLHQATTEEEALNLLFLGDTNRMIAETPMNQASTRSHCIFTIHLSSKEPGSATVRHAKLHLVDLAGSERVAKTGVGGQLLTEAKYINLSLHYLEQVIIALSEKHRAHVPYRNSMMTSVLRDSLGGNCMTTMVATLSLEKRNIDMIIRLQKEIQELKDELAVVTGEQRTEALTEAELLQSVFPGNREVPQLTDDAQDKEGLYKLWRQLLPPALLISSLKATRSTDDFFNTHTSVAI